MYRVAVCEDEPNLRSGLCAQCGEILTGLEAEHEIVSFSSAEDLEAALMGGARFDLLCLDIFLGEKNGMELAQEVRKWDDQVSILFVTSSTEFLLEGYGVRPIQYLLKPVKREELEKVLRTDLRLNHQSCTVTLKANGKTTVLPWADIQYVESRNHGCVFHMLQGEQPFPIALAQVEQLLPKERFCRCHNSYLVNLAQIREATRREILRLDGGRLPIGRYYSEQFQSRFIRYLNNR